jgi:hypothetical protein
MKLQVHTINDQVCIFINTHKTKMAVVLIIMGLRFDL